MLAWLFLLLVLAANSSSMKDMKYTFSQFRCAMRKNQNTKQTFDKIGMFQASVTSHVVSQAAQDTCKCHKSKNVMSYAADTAWEIKTAAVCNSHRRIRK